MRNFLKPSPVIHVRAGKLKAAALVLAMLTSACSQAAPDVPPAGTSGKVGAAVSRATSQLEAGLPLDRQEARSDADGRLEIYVYVRDTSADSLAALTAAGLRNAVPSPAMGVVQGWIAPRDVSALASLDVVTRITIPQYARHY
jgi:hypothetical protein